MTTYKYKTHEGDALYAKTRVNPINFATIQIEAYKELDILEARALLCERNKLEADYLQENIDAIRGWLKLTSMLFMSMNLEAEDILHCFNSVQGCTVKRYGKCAEIQINNYTLFAWVEIPARIDINHCSNPRRERLASRGYFFCTITKQALKLLKRRIEDLEKKNLR